MAKTSGKNSIERAICVPIIPICMVPCSVHLTSKRDKGHGGATINIARVIHISDS